MLNNAPMRALVLACFFLSGASGLIFEMVWTRGLTLVFGSTTLAISTVLTAFMGGLGLGSYLAGRLADRLRDPVRAYALAELAIGLYALLVPLILAGYPALNLWLWSSFGDRYGLLSLLRFIASAGLLLLPTTLMGATLPILGRYLVSRPWELQRVGLRLTPSTCSAP
jgi:spermidine synthase